MKFYITSDILYNTTERTDEQGTRYFLLVDSIGANLAELVNNAVIWFDDGQSMSIHDLRGELYDLVEADLAVQFNKAYQKALEESA